MQSLIKTLSCIALAAGTASALEKEFVDRMLESARNLERDATGVRGALKTKKVDVPDVKQRIDAMSADVNRLQELVTEFEAARPSLSDRDRADWQLIKEKVQLLEIFHGQKKKLASEDLVRNRSLIRAHAEGLAKRALLLRETATKLQRGS